MKHQMVVWGNAIQWLMKTLCTWLVLLMSAHAASFDCAKAGTKIEKMICADTELSILDDELERIYRDIRNKKYAYGINDSQKSWLANRNRCGNAQCVKDSYRQRISDLKDNYRLILSKDSKLCNEMLALFNDDMKAYGRIRFHEHEIFRKIEWKADEKFGGLLQALFDINNDGKKELVLRTNQGFHGIDTDHYYIFPENSDILSKLSSGAGGWRALFDTHDKLVDSDNYDLNELKSLDRVSLSVYILLNPFIYEGVTYISMSEVSPHWIVIAKYLKEEKLQDICYFHNKRIQPFVWSPTR